MPTSYNSLSKLPIQGFNAFCQVKKVLEVFYILEAFLFKD